MKRNMINIAPMYPGKEKEIAADLIRMYETGTIQSVLYCCTLVPEGNPVSDKAARLAELFRENRKALGDSKLPAGVLIQATLGHGWTPAEQAPFQKFVFHDGTVPYIFCPLDPGFLEYVRKAMHTLALEKPDFFMVDDDTRMFTCRGGCFCPRHMEGFNKLTGKNYTREELYKALLEDDALAKVWDDFQQEGLFRFAEMVRREFDAVNPETPGMFCCCSGDVRHAPKMAQLLAAKGQNPTLRINNGFYLYMHSTPIDNLKWMQKTAIQRAHAPENFSILCETDTCPHGRYATSAVALHGKYAWSLLNGFSGGKLWVTDLSDYTPEAGTAYRKKLAANNGFYDQIFNMKPEWQGLVSPLFPYAPFNSTKSMNGELDYISWSTECFGFTGLPFAFAKEPPANTIVTLSRREAEMASDAQLEKFFSGKLLLDGGAAAVLAKRGYSEKMGVSVAEWDLPNPTFERAADGKELHYVTSSVKLTPLSGAEVRSTLYHAPYKFAKDSTELTPGFIRFRNKSGGTVYTSAGKLACYGFDIPPAVHLKRKAFLLKELEIPVWYAGDEPAAFHVFMDRGNRTLCLFNLGFDPIEGVSFGGLAANSRMKKLNPDGSWTDVPFENGTVQTTLLPMELLFLRVSE